GVGGRPMRSNVARRISVRLSANGAGASFFSSNLASTNASTGVLTHTGFWTFGGSGFLTGWNDQCFARTSATVSGFASVAGLSGQGTPILTQAARTSTASSGSFWASGGGGILVWPV